MRMVRHSNLIIITVSEVPPQSLSNEGAEALESRLPVPFVTACEVEAQHRLDSVSTTPKARGAASPLASTKTRTKEDGDEDFDEDDVDKEDEDELEEEDAPVAKLGKR